MSETLEFVRTRPRIPTKPPVGTGDDPLTQDDGLLMLALNNPIAVTRELNNRSLYHFLQYFWSVYSSQAFKTNWHIEKLCKELEKLAEDVAARKPRDYDLIINVPPGTSKTVLTGIMFPAWCWTKWYWMRFITASYSKDLALETAEYSRDLIRSSEFQRIYPDIDIKSDKDTKSNFRIVKKVPGLSANHLPKQISGGSRYSTSVGSTLTGFHADIIIIDDPLNPKQAASDVELKVATSWMDETVPSRKTDKAVTPTILIMQRLNQGDPTGHMLEKQKANIRHICLPGECRSYIKQVKPAEWVEFYRDDLLDPIRMPWKVLQDMEADLGQYGYAGQFGQNPTPPGGGMFKVDHFQYATTFPNKRVDHTVRYWDKAGTQDGGAYTVGVRMCKLENGFYVVEDVKRGQWGTNQREDIIKQTAIADGLGVHVWIETEPGSSGKESSENTIRNLAGFVIRAEHPTGDKATRADPYSVQVNNGSVILMQGEWNKKYVDELRFFPFSTTKDQADASSGAFGRLVSRKIARRVT